MSDIEDELTAGYRRFRAEHWPTARAEYETLATKGQKPHTLIVACSDSRADPALIFDAKPGELFVVRNVANLVPYEPDGKLHGVSAALEFGVKVLGVKRIVVMGHAHCGGVNAMINGAPEIVADFVAPWIAQGAPVVQHVAETVDPDQLERAAEEAIVRLSIRNLRTFPWIAEREAKGELQLSGLHFGIAEGALTALTDKPRFEPLD